MSALAPLLEVQENDLATGRLREKRNTLPEREALSETQAGVATLRIAHEAAQEQREELARAERELGGEVSSISSKAKEIEKNLYSGSVTIPKELDALQHELALFKQKQEDAEERELELLEQIDSADAELAQQEARGSEMEASVGELTAAIAAAEKAIDEEIADLEQAAGGLRTGLPAPILAAYDRLRANARLGGRAAAALNGRMCEGCRLDLPVLENRRIRDEPEDAIVSCVHCSRLLVR